MISKLFSAKPCHSPGNSVCDLERTGLSISQVTDEVLYTGLIEMQEMEELDDKCGWATHRPRPLIHKVVSRISV